MRKGKKKLIHLTQNNSEWKDEKYIKTSGRF